MESTSPMAPLLYEHSLIVSVITLCDLCRAVQALRLRLLNDNHRSVRRTIAVRVPLGDIHLDTRRLTAAVWEWVGLGCHSVVCRCLDVADAAELDTATIGDEGIAIRFRCIGRRVLELVYCTGSVEVRDGNASDQVGHGHFDVELDEVAQRVELDVTKMANR